MSAKKSGEDESSSSSELVPDDSIRCKCGSKFDNKGLMLCCEKCEMWSHAVCYRIKKTEVPEKFFCLVCVPPPTTFDFSHVANAELRGMLESDRDTFGFKPGPPRKKNKPNNEYVFRQEERPLLERYWKLYAQGDSDFRSVVADNLGVLLGMPADGVEAHFVLMAEDVLDGARDKKAKPELGPHGAHVKNLSKQGSVSKSVQDDRTTKVDLAQDPAKSCAVGGLCGQGGCVCRNNDQECARTSAGGCVYCGCRESASCSNCSIGCEEPSAPFVVVPLENGIGWKYIVTDHVAPGKFICEVVGRVADSGQAFKNAWTSPLKRECRELFIPERNLMWDQEKNASESKFIQRSCNPSCVARAVWVDKRLRLGVWAGVEGLKPGQEVTVAWDRPWDSLTSCIRCACGQKVSCPVWRWYAEREAMANTFPVVKERIGTRRVEVQRPNKLAAQLESTLNPFPPVPDNRMSREERKLQQVLKTFEKMERQEKAKVEDPASPASPPGGAAAAAQQPVTKKVKVSSEESANGVDVEPVKEASPPPPPPPQLQPAPIVSPPRSSPTPAPPAPTPVSVGNTGGVSTPKLLGGRKMLLNRFSQEDLTAPQANVVEEKQQEQPSLAAAAAAAPAAYGWKKRVQHMASVDSSSGNEEVALPIKKFREDV